ncbi:MAG: class I SAM-dependent methyltransferase [Alphaproteobacteria bacterium]|nr:class I SAM-dependent methyltransferase [Alphaproteobacteria bacterium]
MTDKVSVEDHYGRADLLGRLLARLAEHGIAETTAARADFSVIDQMHLRGHLGTEDVIAALALAPGMRVLDLGAGLGGPARVLADVHGVHVTALDLTSEFCAVSRAINARLGLDDRVTVVEGDATATGLPAGSFDRVVTIHACMNIPDKAAVYREAFRALKPGGLFCFYDAALGPAGEPYYPVPWAGRPAISHLIRPEAMAAAAEEAGFQTLELRDLTEETKAWSAERRAEATRREAAGEPPPLQSGDILMGDTGPEKMRNMGRNLAEGRVSVALGLFKKPE